MANDPSTIDPKLLQGIEYFERMLQVMPDDRQALEFLCVAYEQVGELDKRRQALIALAGLLLKEGDLDSAERIGERLMDFEQADAQAMLQKISLARNPSLISSGAGKAEETTGDDSGEPSHGAAGTVPAQQDFVLKQTAIKAEVNLVQNLAQAHVIDEYATGIALQRLSEYTNAPGAFLISALTILEKENSVVGEAAAAYVADTAGAPPIPIEAFNFTEELLRLLPASTMRTRGVLPFARLQDAVLVATLNPTDQLLRQEVETTIGSPCVFYLAPPRAMDELLERLFPEGGTTVATPNSTPGAV